MAFFVYRVQCLTIQVHGWRNLTKLNFVRNRIAPNQSCTGLELNAIRFGLDVSGTESNARRIKSDANSARVELVLMRIVLDQNFFGFGLEAIRTEADTDRARLVLYWTWIELVWRRLRVERCSVELFRWQSQYFAAHQNLTLTIEVHKTHALM
jgi:hypothetical protein